MIEIVQGYLNDPEFQMALLAVGLFIAYDVAKFLTKKAREFVSKTPTLTDDEFLDKIDEIVESKLNPKKKTKK
jgi:hypothetical protein